MKNLQIVILPGRQQTSSSRPFYDEAYRTWRLVWEKTHREELDGASELYSDQFLAQDFHGCLFSSGQCVAIASFQRVDLATPSGRDLSWLHDWPRALVERLGQSTPDALIISKFTVHPDFRRTQTSEPEFNVAYRLTEIVSYVTFDGGYQVGLGMTRNDRSVNKLAAYGGSTQLGRSVAYGKIEIDLIGFYPEQLRQVIPKFPAPSHVLWEERMDFRTLRVTKQAA